MSNFKVYSLLAVICSVVVLGRAEDVITQKPVTLIPPHHKLNDLRVSAPTTVDVHDDSNADHRPTTAKLNTTTPTTTTSSSTTPPPAPPNTTTTPTTTTSSSTTPPPAPPNTTTTPTTTTSSSTTSPPAPPNTTTPKPQPQPKPEQGKWWYTNATNITCVVVQFAAQINVSYTMIDQNSGTKMEYVQLTVPKNAQVVNGSCDENRQWLEIQWYSENNTLSNNSMTMVFVKNITQQYLQSFQVSLWPHQFVNAVNNSIFELSYNGSDWVTPVSNSYRCSPPSKLKLNGNPQVPIAELSFSELQEEAFRSNNDENFSVARECGGGDLPDAVPIAVGCALGGMVVVVLIAYLVGRRRSAARGYLSM